MLLNFGEPFMNLLALGFGLGTYVTKLGDVPFAEFIGPGLLASTVMMSVAFDMSFSGFNRLHRDRTYDAMVTGPLNVPAIVGGEILWEATRGLLYAATFLVVLLILGLLHAWTAVLILPLAVPLAVVFAAPSLVVAAYSRIEDHIFYYSTLVITPMFMFSGIFFPVDRLPPIAREVIWFAPLYHAVNLMRALALGQIYPAWWHDLLWLVLAALVVLPWPVAVLRRTLDAE